MSEEGPGLIDRWKIIFESNAKQLLDNLKGMEATSKAWTKALTTADSTAKRVFSGVQGLADKGTQRLNKFRGVVDSLKIVWEQAQRPVINFDQILDASVRSWIQNIERFAQAANRSFEETAVGLHQAGVPGLAKREELAEALKLFEEHSSPAPAEQLTGALTSLGGTVSTVVLGLIGVAGVASLKAFVNEMVQAAQVTMDYQFALFQLNTAIRATQRTQGDAIGTVEEWADKVLELRETFGVFTTADVREAVASALLFTRELGFSKDQIEELIDATAILAEINGKTMANSLRSIIVGMTGYRVALRRLKIHVDDAAIAEEAQRQGIDESVSKLSQQEKALLTLNIILRQTASLSEDAAKAQETLQGRVTTAKAQIQDASEILGRYPAAIKAGLTETWADLITFLAQLMEWFQVIDAMYVRTIAIISGAAKLVGTVTSELLKGNIALSDFGDELEAGMIVVVDEANQKMLEYAANLAMIPPLAEDVAQDLSLVADAINEIDDALSNIAQELIEDVFEAFEAYQERLAEVKEDAARKMEEDEEDHLEKMKELHEDYLLDIERAEQDAVEKRADLAADLADKLADIDDKLKAKEADEADDFRKKELRKEEDFVIKMRRLHARYVESLLDALIIRDARAILTLQRRYRRQRQEAVEDFELAKKRRLEDYEGRLDEQKEWAEDQREQAIESHEDRLKDLEKALARRRKTLLTNFNRRIQDAKKSFARQRADAKLSLRRRLQDLQANLNSRLRALGQALAEEENITRIGAFRVYKQLLNVFGPAGFIDDLMESFATRFARRISIKVAVEGTKIEKPLEEKYTGRGFSLPPPTGVTLPTTTTTRTTTTTTQDVNLHVTADEHFSRDFEEQLYDIFVRIIAPLISTELGLR